MKPTTWLFIPLFLAIASIEAQASGIVVKVCHPQAINNAITVEGQGKVVLQKKNSLTALSEGRVAKVFALVGDPVKKGQVLLTVSNPESDQDIVALRRKIKLNRQSLALMERKCQDSNEMLNLGVAAKSDVSGLKNEIYIKKMETADLEASLGKLLLRKGNERIRANANGYLTQMIPEGSYLTYGQEVATIIAPANEQIEVQIPYERAVDVKPGQPANIQANGLAGKGRVIRVFPVSTANLVKVLVRPERPLPLDLNVQVKLTVKSKRGLMIPKGAIALSDGKTVVYVLKGNKVQQRGIRIDKAYEDRAIISQGLTPRDEVVLNNVSILSDGAEVSLK